MGNLRDQNQQQVKDMSINFKKNSHISASDLTNLSNLALHDSLEPGSTKLGQNLYMKEKILITETTSKTKEKPSHQLSTPISSLQPEPVDQVSNQT